jgi:hypothetical protein
MARRTWAIAAVFAAIALCLYPFISPQTESPLSHHGNNSTVLFITNDERGLANVHMATAYALLEHYPHITIHYASFPKLASQVKQVATLARRQSPNAKDIVFHSLPRPSYLEVLEGYAGGDFQSFITHPPGLEGIDQLCRLMQVVVSPWAAEDYYTIYKAAGDIIDEVDPAVVVLDVFIGPGVDATKQRDRMYSVLTPNVLADLFPAVQPWWTLFWKYPAYVMNHYSRDSRLSSDLSTGLRQGTLIRCRGG